MKFVIVDVDYYDFERELFKICGMFTSTYCSGDL